MAFANILRPPTHWPSPKKDDAYHDDGRNGDTIARETLYANRHRTATEILDDIDELYLLCI